MMTSVKIGCRKATANAMTHPTTTRSDYRLHIHEIYELKDERLYGFLYLKQYISVQTLVRERDAGRLICHGERMVLGRWVKAWSTASASGRQKFVKMKIDGRWWPGKG